MSHQTFDSTTNTPNLADVNSAKKRKAFIDGTNILLGLEQGGKPSVLLFGNIIDALQKQDFDVIAIFDNSVRYHLEKRGAGAEWDKLQELARASDGQISFSQQADPHLLAMADALRDQKAVVVSYTDRYRTWTTLFPKGLPDIVRVQYLGGMLSFAFGGAKPVAIPVKTDLTLFGVRLDAPTPGKRRFESAGKGERVLTSRDRTSTTLRARLIVFALDASGSMFNKADGACQTFDGRRKSEHLAEIFKDAVCRLAQSKSSASFYAGVIAFAGTPAVLEISGSRMVHISHLKNHVCSPSFDYVSHAKGIGTDVAGAIDAAVTLIDGVLSSPDARYIATKWSACVIFISDAIDSSGDDRVRETIARIGMTRSGLASGQIDVGCVGIGTDLRESLLIDMASTPSPSTRQVLTRQGLAPKLLTRSTGDSALAIKVSTKDPAYPNVIRGFVDVVSQTTQA